MTRPDSPPQPCPRDHSAGFGTSAASRSPFSTRRPLYAPMPAPSSPRTPTTHFMATTSSASANSTESRYQPSLMAIDEAALPWTSSCDIPHSHLHQGNSSYQNLQPYTPEASPLFDYASHGLPYVGSYQLGYSSVNAESSCPRTYSDLDFVSSIDNITESYPPSAYLLEPRRPQDMMDLSNNLNSRQVMQFDDDYNPHCQQPLESEAIEVATYATPQYEPESHVANATVAQDLHPLLSDETCKRDMVHEENNVDKEQPYAQLIYRALMGAPGHTMVLRDIYNWFRRNTDKATDKETKGWQNSIRHNLSMNGAFEKVDQPAGEEAKKGFMWRLTENAIREGVKSTTRYRSKVPNKRGCRSQNPAPQRQASGAKGGQAARKAARLRRSERLRDSRSVPMHKAESFVIGSGLPPHGIFDNDNFATSDLAMNYPASPYFCHPEMDFTNPIKQEALPPSFGPSHDLLVGHSYPGSPQRSICVDMPFLLSHSTNETLFYGSGSDSGDEPMTPPSPLRDCQLDTSMQMCPSSFAETEVMY